MDPSSFSDDDDFMSGGNGFVGSSPMGINACSPIRPGDSRGSSYGTSPGGFFGSISPNTFSVNMKQMRKFNNTGTSDVFSPPQNTPPYMPIYNPQTGATIHQPAPVAKNVAMRDIADIEREFELIRIKEDIATIEINDNIIPMLLPYQLEHVQNLQYALEKNQVALDGSDTGTGKSYAAGAVSLNMGLQPFIICPKNVILSWYEILETMGITPLAIVNYETLKNGKFYRNRTEFIDEVREECPYIKLEKVTNDDGTVKVVGYEWRLPDNTLVVIDEAHKGKNGVMTSDTANSKLMVALRPSVVTNPHLYVLFLSATVTDKMKGFAAVAYIMGLYSPYQKKAYARYIRHKDFKDIHNIVYPALGSRMSIDEIKKNTGNSLFRVNDVQADAVSMDPEIEAQIEEAHQEIAQAMTQLRHKIANSSMMHPLTVILRARQKIEMLKVAMYVDAIIEEHQAGNSVVMFCNFNETLRVIADKIEEYNNETMSPIPYDYIWGDQSSEERENNKVDFRDGDLHLLLCNNQAGGECISLHDVRGVRPRAALHSPTWSAILFKQSLGRIYRSGSKSDARQRVLFVNSGIERYICDTLQDKLKNISMLNNGDLENYENFLPDIGTDEAADKNSEV